MNETEEKPKLTLEELMETAYKLTPRMLSDLKEAFYADLTILQACLEAGISKSQYYEWVGLSDEFADLMEAAQNNIKVKSKKILKKLIDSEDIDTAKWVLSRREKDRYSIRTELTGDEGTPLESGVNELKEISSTLNKLLDHELPTDSKGDSQEVST